MNHNITPTIKYIGVDDTTLDMFESQYIIPKRISSHKAQEFDIGFFAPNLLLNKNLQL